MTRRTPAASRRRRTRGRRRSWAERRFDLVVAGNLAKFGQHGDLRDFLLGTGLAADHAHSTSPEHWPGLNLLGFALMEVRQRLR